MAAGHRHSSNQTKKEQLLLKKIVDYSVFQIPMNSSTHLDKHRLKLTEFSYKTKLN
ncbi:hypothetical protein D3C72_2302760 [compost metagenome]